MDLLWLLRHALKRRTDWSWYPLRNFKFGRRCKVPLKPYLERYAPNLNGAGDRFRLTLLQGVGYGYFVVNTTVLRLSALYTDAEYGFALENRLPLGPSTPLALVTFDLQECFEGSWAVVRQLQGVKGQHKLLNGVRWERMLLDVVTDWARSHKCDGVACIRGQDSAWAYKVREDKLYLRYDVSARRNGFRYDEKDKLWRLHLTPPITACYVCPVCGKRSMDRDGKGRHDYGWDTSCRSHAVLCHVNSFIFDDKGRLSKAIAVETE